MRDAAVPLRPVLTPRSALQVQAEIANALHNHFPHLAIPVQGMLSNTWSPATLNDARQVNTPRKNLQTLGVAALYVSAKFEERFPPPLRDLEYITGYRCSAEPRSVFIYRAQMTLGCSSNTAAILEMESAILVAVRSLAPQLSALLQQPPINLQWTRRLTIASCAPAPLLSWHASLRFALMPHPASFHIPPEPHA